MGHSHYLDHASTTPVRPAALEAMVPWLSRTADPARVHADGRMARHTVETARDSVATLLGVRPRDVVFTSTGTEALNWCVYAAAGLTPRSRGPWGRRILVSAVEHSAVLDAARAACAKAGLDLEEIPVDRNGIVRRFEVPDDAALVAVQHANHETGVVQPVDDVRERCRSAGVRLLVDACQSVGLPIPTADLVVVSSHKRGGPAGVAALGLARRVRIDPLFLGGEQELLRRAGGENVAGVVGFGAACAEAFPDLTPLRDRLVDGLSHLDGVEVLGRQVERAPHIVSCIVEGVSGEAMLLGLDDAGVAANSGSSCSAERLEPSHVHLAMGVDADASLRFSLGWPSSAADVDAAIVALPPVIDRLRSLRREQSRRGPSAG